MEFETELKVDKTVRLLVETTRTAITRIARFKDLALALSVTSIFYLTALKNGSRNAGFLYTGDVLGWYLPALAKTQSLLHSYNFTAIDFSTFNGSSDFFLGPNFFPYHPLVILYSLLVSPESTDFQRLGQIFVILMAVHSFFAFYFSLKLLNRFFGFEFGTAALSATVFAFSMHFLNALGQPPFLLCVSVTPWVVYAALAFAHKPSTRLFVFACFPVILAITGGYMPLAAASLAFSAVLIAAKLLYIDSSEEESVDQRVRSLFLAALPYLAATAVAGPFIYSIVAFHKETLGGRVGSLFYSAHQLSQLPQNLLNSVSSKFYVPGPASEFTILWGIPAISIAAIFLLGTQAHRALTSQEWKLFKVAVLIYFATVLATFGDYSVVSDLVYYLLPQIGRMHIYQRFLLPTELMFGVLFALMLKAVVHERPIAAIRIAITLLVLATISVAYLLAFKPELSRELGLNNYIVIELFIGFLFSSALLVPSKNFVYAVAIVLFSLPGLNRMYDYAAPHFSLEESLSRHVIVLDDKGKSEIVSYFKRNSNKAIIKYVDITPMWNDAGVSGIFGKRRAETFSKVFPYYTLNELLLSSYGGFTFYLSARAEYMKKMPVLGDEVILTPDWDFLMDTGADFLVARESDLLEGTAARNAADLTGAKTLRLPNEVVIVPLKKRQSETPLSRPEIFDNGYFKIFKIPGGLENIALGKPARQSSDAGADAMLAVDGNTNGDFKLGSVSHTLRDVNAWLEVDLGSSRWIDHVTVWNRTDCCDYCLKDFWLFISTDPFKPTDTAIDLRARPGIWNRQNAAPNPKSTVITEGAQGRYVRLQLPGNGVTLKECFLSLAEVEVFGGDESMGADSALAVQSASDPKAIRFDTDHAGFLKLELDLPVSVAVQYLFSDNPRLKYYLNGKRIEFTDEGGKAIVPIPPGKNTFEVRYRHWPLTAFWVLYATYSFVLLWFLLPNRFRSGVRRKPRLSGTE